MDDTRVQLDRHYINTTLRTFRRKTGTKFQILSDAQFQKDCLDAHNRLRTRHGCPSLSYSQELADQAQVWAEKLAKQCMMLFLEQKGVGENVTCFHVKDRSDTLSGEFVAAYWARQMHSYDFYSPQWKLEAKEFTQMTWKSTREFGVGRAVSEDTKNVYVVGLYRPAGNSNYMGEFERNVPKPADFPVMTPTPTAVTRTLDCSTPIRSPGIVSNHYCNNASTSQTASGETTTSKSVTS